MSTSEFLDNKICVFVPSTVKVSHKINNAKQVNKTLFFMSGLFGGCTTDTARGAWVDQSGALVIEKVDRCCFYCTEKQLKEHISTVLAYCNSLKQEMEQECISLEINNKLCFV